MTATCKLCGETWTRDPALEVPCPTCRAKVGSRCKRPSGHECDVHVDRDQLAMDMGYLKPCSTTKKQESQGTLF